MERFDEFCSAIESMLFVSGEPLEISRIAKALEISYEESEFLAKKLKSYYEDNKRGLRLNIFKNKLQLSICEDNYKYIDKLNTGVQLQSISAKAMEVLAIVAYKQPITRMEIDEIRGVKSDYLLSTLIEKELVYCSGQKDTVGNPNLYSTSDKFLMHFGLSNINELPDIKVLEEKYEEN